MESPDPIQAVAEKLDADIYFVSGFLSQNMAHELIDLHETAQGRPNCALILSTFGGEAEAAYIIARFLKRRYERFTLFVFGYCKSAGTIIALGASEIVMSAHGELGPLDVQFLRPDELGGQASGLDILQAISVIGQQAYGMFERNFANLIAKTSGSITTKTAADIAALLASHLLSPITAQINPFGLGETQRAITIAKRYGVLLGANPDKVDDLIYNYPSHGFVIDIEEAALLFPYVREPELEELLLERHLRGMFAKEHGAECVRAPAPHTIHLCLTQKETNENEESDDEPETAPLDDVESTQRSIETDRATQQGSGNHREASGRDYQFVGHKPLQKNGSRKPR